MTVRIIHGVNQDDLPLADRTIEFVAEQLHHVFNIPEQVQALVNGDEALPQHVLADGDRLEFVKTFSQKGGLRDYWSEAELIEHLGADDFERMKRAGLELTMRPVLTSQELFKWEKWLQDKSLHPTDMVHVAVNIEGRSITVEGESFPMKQNECAIVKCLLDAKGEPRSQNDIRARYAEYIPEERIDNTINRSIEKHRSGIGKYISSDKKGFRLTLRKIE